MIKTDEEIERAAIILIEGEGNEEDCPNSDEAIYYFKAGYRLAETHAAIARSQAQAWEALYAKLDDLGMGADPLYRLLLQEMSNRRIVDVIGAWLDVRLGSAPGSGVGFADFYKAAKKLPRWQRIIDDALRKEFEHKLVTPRNVAECDGAE